MSSSKQHSTSSNSEPDELDVELAEARAGSQKALGRLLDASRPYLLKIAGQELTPKLHTKGGASDLVQETHLEAHRGFANFVGATRADFLSWLRKILLHNVADFRRRFCQSSIRDVNREISIGNGESKEDQSLQLAANASSPSSHMVRQEEAAMLERALDDLPEHYRQVVILRHKEKLSHQEIGLRLNRSEEAVRKLWARAIQALAERLPVSK